MINASKISYKTYSILLLALLATTSCCTTPSYMCVDGAEEFVIDSYQIRQGKLAIQCLQGIEVSDMPYDAMDEYQDEIYEDDILNIGVWHPTRPDLMESIRFINDTIGFRVVRGYVTIPDLPPVYLIGYTLDEAKGVLQTSLKEHYKDIEVFVTYRDRLQRKVDLAGLVATPTIPVDGKIRLYEVLSRAHVPNGANLFHSYVMRDGQQLPVDLFRLVHNGDMSHNIVMRGGDKIFIAEPSEARVLVMGEVLAPKPVPVPSGFLSLREALVAAGGIPFTGNRNCIQVIRGDMSHPKIYLLNWEEIIHLPNDSLLLMPGDTVYVSETPITQWNRFISQLLPSFSGVQTSSEMWRTLSLF